MSLKNKQPKVALVYDKINTKFGGAEVVLKSLCQAFPNAPIFTSVYDDKNAKWAENYQIIPGFLQKIPGVKNKHQWLSVLMPLNFELHNFDKYDVVISVTSGESKGIITKPEQLHICYMLTPPRYLYTHKKYLLEQVPLLNIWPIKQLASLCLSYITWWDQVAAQRPDHIISISKLVEGRIAKFYQRNSDHIVYPPVQINTDYGNNWTLELEKPYFLSLSRLVAYKRVDLSIRACLNTNKMLLVAGRGNQEDKLKAIAPEKTVSRENGETISNVFKRAVKRKKLIVFLGHVSDSEAKELLEQTEALIMPGIEDFGITAIEAASLGTPTIIAKESGASELLGNQAVLLPDQDLNSLVGAISQFKKNKFDKEKLKKIANNHSVSKFTSQFQKIVYDLFIQHLKKGPNAYK